MLIYRELKKAGYLRNKNMQKVDGDRPIGRSASMFLVESA